MSDLHGVPATESRDRDIERAIGRVLHAGVLASTACLAVGLLLEVFGLGRASGDLLQMGLLLLLATPVARVVTSVVEYALGREWMFVGLTLVVLAELLASVIAAFR